MIPKIVMPAFTSRRATILRSLLVEVHSPTCPTPGGLRADATLVFGVPRPTLSNRGGATDRGRTPGRSGDRRKRADCRRRVVMWIDLQPQGRIVTVRDEARLRRPVAPILPPVSKPVGARRRVQVLRVVREDVRGVFVEHALNLVRDRATGSGVDCHERLVIEVIVRRIGGQ